jgi:hypothetical protein
MAALAATIAPAALYCVGRIGLDAMTLATNLATLAWFATAPLWLGRKPASDGADRA